MIIESKVIKYQDNVDTDVIIPARYLNDSSDENMARHCMEDLDPTYHERVKENKIIVAGFNFGCGSSREHAPLALKASGAKLVIAKSFARIFYRNAINIGMPIIECEAAAEAIENGDLVYIDAGTTTGSMIEHINCYEATYVTNGVRHAMELARHGFKTYLLSGQIKASTEAVIGYDAVDSLKKYHFNKCFIGTDGIDINSGLTTADIEESMVKTEAIRRSENVYILADNTKFGLVASVTFAPLEAGTIITDQLLDESYRSKTEIIVLDGEME